MLLIKRFSAVFAICVFVILTTTTAIAADSGSKYDVVGITLGMTVEDAKQKLRDFGIEEQSIYETRMSYSYSDGVNHNFKTDDFVYRIIGANEARYKDGKQYSDSITLYFSPPPEGGRLVGLQRLMLNGIDPVTGGQFKQAVIDKYGEPTAANSNTLNWKFGSGNKNCLSASQDGTGVALPDSIKNKSILDMVFVKRSGQYRLDLFRVSRVKNLDECANMLEFKLTATDTKPANSVTTTMIDIPSWVQAELAAGAEVERLRKAAVEKREGKGKVPAL
ncbi:hypothetical protein [Rheinheimera aquimaris]|jgi:hypothetical protein|uniref:hypothetical protein n=1 Tax=Rheinheimera aquimaris TaxID=412437 RepID=UPI000E93A10A|nr:hypothetical protein [Rheinheimera aquimaris]HBN88105.1 hypothetical protein [Rheinheimera sp.]|tara:strand:+ start:1492 stop:2322 length:831 start_codon:yes stop_codon:yes gene_type:complete